MAQLIRKGTTMNLTIEATKKLEALTTGEITFAEIAGITFQRAQQIAQTGCDLAAAGQLEDARVIFEGLVTLNRKDTAAHAALGTVYQRLGRIDDALASYGRALAGDPKNVVALANRGELRMKRGEVEGMDDLVKAVAADPNGELPASRRAQALLKAAALAKASRK